MLNKKYSIRWHEWNGTGFPTKRKCVKCSSKNTRTNSDGEPRCIDHFDIELGTNAKRVLKYTRPNGIAPTTEKELLENKNS